MLITMENECFISKPPIVLNRNERGQMHCLDEPAIKFADGYEEYYVDGIHFDRKTYERAFILKNMSGKDIMALKNAEQRACIIKYVGIESLVSEMEGKNIDSYIHEYESNKYEYILWDFGLPIRYVQCPDYSTKRVFFLGVPIEMDNVKKAVAWTYEEDEQSYWIDMKMRT